MPCDIEDEGDISVAETLTPTNLKGVSTQLESDTGASAGGRKRPALRYELAGAQT